MKNIEKDFIKKKGIVGRTNMTDIEKRRRIIKEVLDNRDPELTLHGLKDVLKRKFIGQAMDGSNLSLPTNETIKKDCLAVGYIYKNHRFDLDNQSTQSENMAKYILEKHLKEITAFYNSKTYVFFPLLSYMQTHTYNNNDDIIESNIIPIHDVDDPNSYTEYYDSQIYNLSSEISTNYETIQISIILSEHCYEQTLADIIIDAMQGHFTYIAVNAFCVQIFCKKQNLNNIFDFIRSILPSSNDETMIKYIYNVAPYNSK